jgi:exopolyphosphatase/pppGpp-phosphohydrolase
MRKISEIYKEYKILPNLQEHQLRVAGVAMQICETLDIELNKKDISTACLLHDMGNIIKFDLNQTQVMHGISDSEMENVIKIQDEFIEKYGEDEHKATLDISKELNTSENVFKLLNAVGFSQAQKNLENKNISNKIVCYADMRVAPYGVVSVTERNADGRKRYQNHKNADSDDFRSKMELCLLEIEQQIFSHSKIKPEDITDESIKPYMEKLREFEI